MGMDQPPSQPPMGGSKPPDWGEMGGKLKAAHGPDRLILIAGLLFFVDSFLPWYGVGGKIAGVSFDITAKGWNSGGLAVLAILAAIAATVVAALDVLGMMKDVSIPKGQLQVGLTAAALIFALLRWVTETRATKYGLFFAIVLGAVMTYGGYQKFQASTRAA
jgi:hypothetical protein